MSMPTDPTRVEYPLALRLLDHQIDGHDGAVVAKVDDVELEITAEGIVATALLCGPGALGQRLPGRLGRWTLATWRRLSDQRHPAPIRIPLEHVQRIGSAITLTREAATAAGQQLTLERWVGDNLINRIPGSGLEPNPEPDERRRGAADLAKAEPTPTVLLSHLLTFRAFHGEQDLGTVHEVNAQSSAPNAPVVGRLAVISYVIGPRASGSTLGYDQHPEHGPYVIRALVRGLHRKDRRVDARDVHSLDIAQRRLDVHRRQRSSRS
jgi:sporulation protein YlmC with PRC-barrel domain